MQEIINSLVNKDEIQQAIDICKQMLDTEPQHSLHWRTQLGYLYFLNEQNSTEDFYMNAPDTFRKLTQDYPTDMNSKFWLGYIQIIAFDNIEIGIQYLTEALEIAPSHPYANLVLSSYYDIEESTMLLQNVLKQQMLNFRALMQIAYLFKKKGKMDEAKNFLNIIINEQAFTETNYGSVNTYINEVFINSTQQDIIKQQAQEMLLSCD